ncbi:MAG: nuclear transport factor 2 family protein [Gammaproteobacteria bacterium]
MDPVEAQLEAYNIRDIDRYLLCFAPDAVVVEDTTGQVLYGHSGIRELYGRIFADHPTLHCQVVQRIRVGTYVIDEERITGRAPEPLAVVAIYRVGDGHITHLRLLR